MKFGNYRTLIVLTFAQCFGQTAAPILVLLGGIVGAQIAPSIDWATLPIAIQIAGIAFATIPASYLMSKIGRKAWLSCRHCTRHLCDTLCRLGYLSRIVYAVLHRLFPDW